MAESAVNSPNATDVPSKFSTSRVSVPTTSFARRSLKLKSKFVGTLYSSSPWTGFLRVSPLPIAHCLALVIMVLIWSC